MRSRLATLAESLSDLTPEEWAELLPIAAAAVKRAPHWRGGRSDLAHALARAGGMMRAIVARRGVETEPAP